jgi:hypothetical protein
VVFGHITMWNLYHAYHYNVWLDIKPAHGHRVDLFERPLHRNGPGDRARHVDGEEQAVEAALAHAGIVDVIPTPGRTAAAAHIRLVTIEEAPARLKQTLGGVDVGVEDDGLGMDSLRSRGQVLGGLRLGLNEAGGEEGEGGAKRHSGSAVH